MPPLLSVGLPVHNGEKYLRESIESILTQSFHDFELIISDNASTDRTKEICLEYASRDRRVRYHRNNENIGGARNANLTFRMARGKYFRWAAHDDICEPTLFQECIAILENDSSVILCYSMSCAIDGKGKQLGIKSWDKASMENACNRFENLTRYDHHCEAIYGIIRSVILSDTRLNLDYTGSDRTLLSILALYGRFFEVKQPLFLKRFHEENVYSDWRERMAWFNPTLAGKIVFPHWLHFFDYMISLRRVQVPWLVRFRCYAFICTRWILANGGPMIKDLGVALGRLLARFAPLRTKKESNQIFHSSL